MDVFRRLSDASPKTKLNIGLWSAAALGFLGLSAYSFTKQRADLNYLDSLPEAQVSLRMPLGPYENPEVDTKEPFSRYLPRDPSKFSRVVDSNFGAALVMSAHLGSPRRHYDLYSSESKVGQPIGDSIVRIPQALSGKGAIIGVKKDSNGEWIPYITSALGMEYSIREPFERRFGDELFKRVSRIRFSKLSESYAYGSLSFLGRCSAFVYDLDQNSIKVLPSVTPKPDGVNVIDASEDGWIVGRELPGGSEATEIFVAWKRNSDGGFSVFRLDDILRGSFRRDDGTVLKIELLGGFEGPASVVAVCERVDRRDLLDSGQPLERGVYEIRLDAGRWARNTNF